MKIFFSLLFVLSPFLSLGQWIQLGQDIDGESAQDYSGRSVAISSNGDVVAIGADLSNDNISGHVRVYQYFEDSWQQIGQDIDGEAAEDQSGRSVALSSNGFVLAIGTGYNDGNGNESGHVRVYEFNNDVWQQIGQDIDGEAPEDFSGESVSLSSDGNIVAIGAPFNDGNGIISGHVRVFENHEGSWQQIGQDIDGELIGDTFGNSVSLSSNGRIIAIGARHNDGNGESSGHVRVYEYDNGFWEQVGQDIDGEAPEDRSGVSVRLSSDGNIVAIGSPYNDGNGNESGHIRVYEFNNDLWEQVGQDIDGESSLDHSGVSMSLSSDGNIVAIGAPNNFGSSAQTGQVRVYENNGGVWQQIGEDIDGEGFHDQSGTSVSLSSDGSIVAIGAWFNDGNGDASGHVRVYQYSTLSIEDNNFGIDFKVYPNPVSDKAMIVLGSNYDQVNIQTFDTFGKQISVSNYENVDEIALDIKNLKTGVYFVKVTSKMKHAIIKLIKK